MQNILLLVPYVTDYLLLPLARLDSVDMHTRVQIPDK